MAFFHYRARDKQGALITGILEAEDRTKLESVLDKMGLIPIKVVSTKSGATGGFSGFKDFFQKIPEKELIIFSRQLATLFGAGIPLTKALFALERQTTNPKFASIVKTMREDVEGGSSFAHAIAKHSKVFPELYSSMIEAGEAAGILDSVLARLALILEKNAENKAKVKSATLYPKIVISALLIAIAILMNFVVPRFAKLYSSFKIELPLPTRILIYLSNKFSSYWYFAAALIALLFLLIRFFLSTEAGKFKRDWLRVRMPIFGPLILKATMSRFARILGSLYRSGLPILQSLDIASRSVENRLIAIDIKAIEDEVRSGKSLSEPMGKSTFFPPMIVQMVTVGEETGNLDEMLEKAAEYYEQEVESVIRNLTTTLEPLLLSIIFVFVLFLALAIFMPMWDIIKVVKR